jgi:hypothetical protein
MASPLFSRRRWLQAASLAVAAGAGRLPAAEPPQVSRPRATSGDRVEPDWQQRLTITVGRAKADLIGTDQRVIQAAVDSISAQGGGIVKILPGTYRFRNAVYLRCNVRIVGAGPDTLVVKEPSVNTKTTVDSDWFDQEITLADAAGFELGDGVCLRTKNPHHGGTNMAKRTLVARSGNRFKLDRGLRDNYWLEGNTTVATLFPLFSGENVSDVTIENLALDGNKEKNLNLDGNHAGCIFCQDCSRLTFRGLVARNYNGDGISWQVCHDVRVEDCYSHNNVGLGLHPGSGSQRPVMRNNRLQANNIGLFFCWGVQFGLAENNLIEDNQQSGISIGHRDNDNRVVGNTVRRSGKFGVLFRRERGPGYAALRNHFENNRIEDSGGDDGVAVEVLGWTRDNLLRGNTLVETRGPAKRIGIRFAADVGPMRLEDNRIDGFATPQADLRKKDS